MISKLFFTFISVFITVIITQAQTQFTVEVSADTVGVGQLVEIKYIIENGEGRFEAPDLTNLPVVSGPNTSSSFIFQNGKSQSTITYSYILKPLEPGIIEIPKATYEDESIMTIDPVIIVVQGDGPATKLKQTAKSKPDPTRNLEKRKF